MFTNRNVVFLPGLLCDEALWQHQIEAFSGRITPQLADLTGEDSISALARRVLERAPAEFSVVGLSMGGYVAFEIMRQAPQRVQSLCLMDTSARLDTEEKKASRRGLIQLALRGTFRGMTRQFLQTLVNPDALQDEALCQLIIDMATRMGRDTFIKQETAILNRKDSRPTLSEITCPTCVIGGLQDHLTPREVLEEISGGIKGATLHLIDKCGHMSALERPNEVNRILEEFWGL